MPSSSPLYTVGGNYATPIDAAPFGVRNRLWTLISYNSCLLISIVMVYLCFVRPDKRYIVDIVLWSTDYYLIYFLSFIFFLYIYV